jgi:membrane-bound ClpP family serine protease
MKRGDKWDELLTVLFMTLAVVAIVLFFAAKNQPYYLICGGAALVLRVVQYGMRFFS